MPHKISINRKRHRFTNYSHDREHVYTSQVIRGQIGIYGTNAAGCVFPMDQLYTNDGTLAAHINQNSFNNGSNVSMQCSFNEFDGFAHNLTNPQDLASYRFSRGWVSSVNYSLTVMRPYAPIDSTRATVNAGEFVLKDTSEVKVACVGLHPTQVSSLVPVGIVGYPNMRPPGQGPDASFANLLNWPGARYKTLRVPTTGNNKVNFKRKYSLRKLAIPGFPLSSSAYWFKTVTRENGTVPPPCFFIYLYKPQMPQALAPVGDEPEPVTPPCILDFTLKVRLKLTLIEPYLPSNLYSLATFGITGMNDVGYNGVPPYWDDSFQNGVFTNQPLLPDGDADQDRPEVDTSCLCTGITGATGPTGPTGP